MVMTSRATQLCNGSLRAAVKLSICCCLIKCNYRSISLSAALWPDSKLHAAV